MARPTVHPTTELLYGSLGGAFTDRDDEHGWALLSWLDGHGHLLGAVDDLVRDSDDGVGWSVLFDIDRVPDAFLPWLAQAVGVRLSRGITATQQRDEIRAAAYRRRGTPAAIEQSARVFLTGSQRVDIYEREGSAYRFRVRVYAAEFTDDEAALTAAVQRAKPAGLVATVEVVSGATYGDLDTMHGTYGDMDAAYVDYAAQTAAVPA